MLAEDVLSDAGCKVLLAMRIEEALELAGGAELDAAVLDVNLGGGDTSYPVAELLASREVPFIFATGYDKGGIDERYAHCRVVQKPYAPVSLVAAVAAAVGPASAPGS